MNLAQIIARIPKPALVFGVLAIALTVIVFQNPLRDECEIKTEIFLKSMRGIAASGKIKTKIQFAQLGFWRDRCRDGNSAGACEDYFTGLKKMSLALKTFPTKCFAKFTEDENNTWFVNSIMQALRTYSMVAWAEKPAIGPGERLGWLTEQELTTFCSLKKTYIEAAGEEKFAGLRQSIYEQYPDAWPDTVPEDSRLPENRPLALKTAANPRGTLNKNEVFERSLFSIRCDLYQ